MQSKTNTDPWKACTWEGARAEVLLRGKHLSLREKIIWLEQAAHTSIALGSKPAEPNTTNCTLRQD